MARRPSQVLSKSNDDRDEFITLNVSLCGQRYGHDAQHVAVCFLPKKLLTSYLF